MSIVVQAGSTDSFFLETGARFDIQGPCEVLINRWMNKFRVKIGSAEQQVGPFLSDAQVNILATSETTYTVYPAEVWVAPSVLAGADGAAGIGTTDGDTVQEKLDNIDGNLNFTTLTAATTPVDDADLMILRQGSTNKKIDAGTFRTEFATEAVAAQEAAEAAQVAAELAETNAETALADAIAVIATDPRNIWPTTAAGIGQGVAGTSTLVGGNSGTDGTFALAFSGGTQVIAPSGRFVVAGGALVSVTIDYPGYYSAGTPTISLAASSGLTGASVVATMGPNTPVGGYFATPSSADSRALDIYLVTAGPAATLVTTTVSDAILTDEVQHNKINPAAADYVNRYSTGSLGFVTDSSGIAASAKIPVVAGEWYTVSGTDGLWGWPNPQGGNFASEGATTAASNITFVATLSGTGKSFQVPSGTTHVVISLKKLSSSPGATTLNGDVQMEEGRHATAYQAYATLPRIVHAVLPADVMLAEGDEIAQYLKTDDLTDPYSFNKIDVSAVDFVNRYSTGGLNFVTDASGIAASDWIPVVEGEWYTVSGAGLLTIPQGGYFTADGALASDSNITFVDTLSGTGKSFQVPSGDGITHVVLNLRKLGDSSAATSLYGTVQMEEGRHATTYQAYSATPQIKDSYFPANIMRDDGAVIATYAKTADLVEQYSFNKIDPTAADYVNRYSTGSVGLTVDSLGIAASDWIPVNEGEWYAVSGDDGLLGGEALPQGGFFTAYGDTAAHSNITFVEPLSGSGKRFYVPEGEGITHVIISLRKLADNPAATSLHGDVQMEEGSVTNTYQAYSATPKIKRTLLLEGTDDTPFNEEAWYKFTIAESAASAVDKFPVFKKHWLLRDKDLCVVNTGTSLTARSTEHCTAHEDATIRPPLMHSNNCASLLWDRMKWDSQQYRRYDAAASFFTETGTFTTASTKAEWDDSTYRDSLTRLSETSGASVAFTVPIGAWQFNFIYRTDSTGTTTNTVAVAEGDDKMEVYDEGTSAWVEANAYEFSMNEAAPVTRSVSIPSPATDSFASSTISSKANTTYQKRLKMRCKSGAINSLASTKAVTITGSGSGRFMYWGVEWSPREFMLTYINAARGSHNTQATQATGLPRFQDNEVWGFKPDLLFFELPIHNDGTDGTSAYAANYWSRLTNNYVFRSDFELSLVTRGAYFGLSPEIGMFTSSIAYNFGGINEDGGLIFNVQADGSMMTSLDKFDQAVAWVNEEHPDVLVINAVQRWVTAAIAIHGDLKTATLGSGKAGRTFTNEGSHWNDTGCKVMAKVLLPAFDFTR